ncbi:MAG: hypothetical protein M1822_002173 [Bathelium mastoideum]|nr:MAG: hypothetical protein M1822_002173 [Bathelium mastoideum]
MDREIYPFLEQKIMDLPAPRRSFLEFPREIRDIIYDHAANWNDITIHMSRMMEDLRRYYDPMRRLDEPYVSDDKVFPDSDEPIPSDIEDSDLEYHPSLGRWARIPVYPRRSTPTILLLNRQISAETNDVLLKKPLRLTTFESDEIGDPYEYGPTSPLFHLISMQMIQRIPNLEIYRYYIWEFLIPCLDCFPHCGCPDFEPAPKPSYVQTHLTIYFDHLMDDEFDDFDDVRVRRLFSPLSVSSAMCGLHVFQTGLL